MFVPCIHRHERSCKLLLYYDPSAAYPSFLYSVSWARTERRVGGASAVLYIVARPQETVSLSLCLVAVGSSALSG